jgi:hypothetical protein
LTLLLLRSKKVTQPERSRTRILKPRFVERQPFDTVNALSNLSLAQLVPRPWASTVISQLGSSEGVSGKDKGRVGDTAVLGACLFANSKLGVAFGIAAVQVTRYSDSYSH